MRTQHFEKRTLIPAPADVVFQWHARPGALERLLPPWESVSVEERTGGITDGSRVILRVRVGPFPLRWVTRHFDYVEGRQFRDEQVQGPFRHWIHTHTVEPQGPDACVLADRIEYALPCGWLGRLVAGGFTRAALRRMFAYRHAVTQGDIAAHARAAGTGPWTVAVTGSRGLVGSALIPFLTTGGHRVIRLVRGSARSPEEAAWDPAGGLADPSRLEGVEAVVHLAGENIASGRWTPGRKARIRTSRVEGTRRLAEDLARLPRPPKVLVSASAIGLYGDRGDEVLHEDSPPGQGFLPEVCREWEAATRPATEAGIRVVHLRFGLVLSPRGGALGTMLPLFRLGAGGRLGSGRQFTSWIALDDALGVILHAIAADSLDGPVNAVAPGPMTNAEFARTLARVLARPALAPVPAVALRLALGEMGEALLLAGARVWPTRLQDSGYRFRYPELEGALRHLLGR